MKGKLLICLLLGIIASNCEVKVSVKNANAQMASSPEWCEYLYNVGHEDNTVWKKVVRVKGMDYMIITSKGGGYGGNTSGGVSTMNLTRDSLECELLKKQLKK